MRERPILFSAPMVRALLDGTKTQTRRVVKHPAPDGKSGWHPIPTGWQFLPGGSDRPVCPYGKPGDRLWVRETWARTRVFGKEMTVYREGDNRTDYGGPWKPGIHMFRRDSRIDLEVTGVRVERLQDISEADAQAEGCALECMTPTGDDSGSAIYGPGGYLALWESINGAGSWAANPWVWVVEFRRLRP